VCTLWSASSASARAQGRECAPTEAVRCGRRLSFWLPRGVVTALPAARVPGVGRPKGRPNVIDCMTMSHWCARRACRRQSSNGDLQAARCIGIAIQSAVNCAIATNVAMFELSAETFLPLLLRTWSVRPSKGLTDDERTRALDVFRFDFAMIDPLSLRRAEKFTFWVAIESDRRSSTIPAGTYLRSMGSTTPCIPRSHRYLHSAQHLVASIRPRPVALVPAAA
jgi:hypothetical protein